MTKEAKLTAAQRIVPEWKDYDNEIKNLMARVDDEQHHYEGTTKQNINEGKQGFYNKEKNSNLFLQLKRHQQLKTLRQSCKGIEKGP